MKLHLHTALLICQIYWTSAQKSRNYTFVKQSNKFDNPDFIRDRHKYEIYRPELWPGFSLSGSKKFHPSWMDYCDPYHCNDYHKQACGLNRRNKKFKWFQSGCHIILNNQCATFRGFLKYDMVETKYCRRYVMYLRDGCPGACPDETEMLCARGESGHLVLFKNRCFMQRWNCRGGEEFTVVHDSYCTKRLTGMVEDPKKLDHKHSSEVSIFS